MYTKRGLFPHCRIIVGGQIRRLLPGVRPGAHPGRADEATGRAAAGRAHRRDGPIDGRPRLQRGDSVHRPAAGREAPVRKAAHQVRPAANSDGDAPRARPGQIGRVRLARPGGRASPRQARAQRRYPRQRDREDAGGRVEVAEVGRGGGGDARPRGWRVRAAYPRGHPPGERRGGLVLRRRRQPDDRPLLVHAAEALELNRVDAQQGRRASQESRLHVQSNDHDYEDGAADDAGHALVRQVPLQHRELRAAQGHDLRLSKRVQ